MTDIPHLNIHDDDLLVLEGYGGQELTDRVRWADHLTRDGWIKATRTGVALNLVILDRTTHQPRHRIAMRARTVDVGDTPDLPQTVTAAWK